MADNVAVAEQASLPTISPPRLRVVNSNIYTTDITTKFRDAASKLPAGMLIRDDFFTLFESVGALEIGDPKMDSGCIDDGELLEEDFDVARPLLATEVIWLMDELLSREVAWHVGYPLSQTLFTSVYIEKLLWPDPMCLDEAQFCEEEMVRDADPMLHKVFRSYCLGLVKCCDLVLCMVTTQHYYEEEDFATQLYNRELLHRFTVADILAEMDEGLRYLLTTTIDEVIKQSLEARMRFRSDLLSMLSRHTTTSVSPSSVTTVETSLLPTIQSSRSLGTPLEDSFTLKIQRRLASTVPPRPMVTIDESRTFDYLKRFLRDCEHVFAVLFASHSQDLLTSYSTFGSQDPQPSVYVRALMQSWLSKDNIVCGVAAELEFMVNDMASVTLAASPILDALNTHSDGLTNGMRLVKQHLNDFLAKNGRSFLNLWHTVCLNRCRVRRTLCHAALEWDHIQAEAEELDDELQRLVGEVASVYPAGGMPTFSYSISSWVYHYKLTQLRLIAQMGFELDIYAPHELATMYWFLAHVCDTHLAHLERVSFFVSRREATLPPPSRRSAQQIDEAEECRSCLGSLYRQFSWLKATEATARALHALYIILQRHGQFQQPPTTYASDILRYELRMKPFLYLSIPEPLTFDQCHRLSKMEVRSDADLLEEINAHIIAAKKGWEEVMRAKWNAFPLKEADGGRTPSVIDELWTSDVRDAIKATISMSIVAMTLKRVIQPDKVRADISLRAAVPQRGEKEYRHPWWLVPKLTL